MNSGIIYGTTFLREDRTYKDRKLMISDADRKRLEKHLFERIESMLQQEYPVQPDFGADDVKLPPCDV